MSNVALGPSRLSRTASKTVPEAYRFGLALSSLTSAMSKIFSNNSSMPVFAFAEISTKICSPPNSSAMMLSFINSSLTRLGLAVDLSILLIATMIGTSAATA